MHSIFKTYEDSGKWYYIRSGEYQLEILIS